MVTGAFLWEKRGVETFGIRRHSLALIAGTPIVSAENIPGLRPGSSIKAWWLMLCAWLATATGIGSVGLARNGALSHTSSPASHFAAIVARPSPMVITVREGNDLSWEQRFKCKMCNAFQNTYHKPRPEHVWPDHLRRHFMCQVCDRVEGELCKSSITELRWAACQK